MVSKSANNKQNVAIHNITSGKPAKSDLGDIINRSKSGGNPFTQFTSKQTSLRDKQTDADNGFVFQRKKPTASLPKASQVPSNKEEPSAKTKLKLATMRRRKSSIGGLRGIATSRRQSSFGIGMTQKLPPASVKTCDYNKHLLPDLPGPVKMRQLLVWAVQKTLQGYKKSQVAAVEPIAEALIQALLKNELETSWYSRQQQQQQQSNKVDEQRKEATTKDHPMNIELLDTLSNVKQYRQSYQHILCQELDAWKSFEQSLLLPTANVNHHTDNSGEDGTIAIKEMQSGSIINNIHQTTVWANRTLPLSVDSLEWSLQVATLFMDRSKDFCEDIFRQIFARFFSEEAEAPPIDPLLVLKALSSKAKSQQQNAIQAARRKSIMSPMLMEIDG